MPGHASENIHRIFASDGKVYALFPINAPSPAHIFLFHSIAHVKGIVAEADFELLQEDCKDRKISNDISPILINDQHMV